MGMYLIPFGVEISKVKSAFNSKDPTLFEAIQKTEMFQCYGSQDGSYPVKIITALKQMIFGLPQDSSFPPAYGYALMAVVDHFGEKLAKEGDVFKFGSVNENIDRKLRSFKVNLTIEELASPNYRFDIPDNFSDFPMIGGLEKGSLEDIGAELAKIEISKESLDYKNPNYSEALEAVNILKRDIGFCLENNLDWISFVH